MGARGRLAVALIALIALASVGDAWKGIPKRSQKFRSIARSWTIRTLRRKRDHVVGLFATKWDGTGDAMARGVEEALESLAENGNSASNLRNLTLVRFEATYKDINALRSQFGLAMELPALFYFRDGRPYTFSHGDTIDSYKGSLSKIEKLTDEESLPLVRVKARSQLEALVDENEATFVFVDLSPAPASDTKVGADSVDDGASPPPISANGSDTNSTPGGAVIEDGAGSPGEGDASLEGVSDAKHNKEEVYQHFLDLGGKNLLSQVVSFCFVDDVDVLPARAQEAAERLSASTGGGEGEGYLVLAFHGERGSVDVFTSECPCDLLSWLRNFLINNKNSVSTMTDAQFWAHLTEQVDLQTQWTVAQETARKQEEHERITGRHGAQDKSQDSGGDQGSAQTQGDSPSNDYEIPVVLLQSGQESIHQAKTTQHFKSFQAASKKVLDGESSAEKDFQVCKAGGFHPCEALVEDGSANETSANSLTTTKEGEEDPDEVSKRVYTFHHVPYTQAIWRGSLAAMLELTEFPSLMLFDTRSKLYYQFAAPADLTDPEEIFGFVSDHKRNLLKPYLRSQAGIADDGGTGPVRPMNLRNFTSANFPEDCAEGQVVSVVLFHVSWCAYCKRAAAMLTDLARLLQEDASLPSSHRYEGLHATKLYTLDCDRNDCYPKALNLAYDFGSHLDKLPAFVAFPCNRKPVLYQDYKSTTRMLEWLVKMASSGKGDDHSEL